MTLIIWNDIAYGYVADAHDDVMIVALFAILGHNEAGRPLFWSSESGDTKDAVTNVADAEPDMVVEFQPNGCADWQTVSMPHTHGRPQARNLTAAMLRACDVAADFYKAEQWEL